MKISIRHIADHGTIAAAIEAIAADHDSIASGIIGPSFSCSGPGSGWQRNHDVSDYAKRALSGDYGAGSYIDSSDGTEATLDENDEIVWSEESVVEIALPTVEECLEHPDAWSEIRRHGNEYGMDDDDLDTLADKVAEPGNPPNMTRPTDMPCRNWREAKAKLHAIRLQVRTGEPFFFATGITVLRHHAGQCISVMRGALRECRDRRIQTPSPPSPTK